MKLPICPELEARSWLKRSESQKPKPKARRMSVAGSGLYVVDNEVREMGSDFLTRINRTATVATIDNSAANVVASTIVSVPAPAAVDDVIIDACLAGPSGLASIGRSATINSPPSNTNSAENTQLTIRNNFNPFQRLANAPFRRRAQSVSEQVRQPDPPAEESIDFSKDLYPYPAQRTYRMRRSSSFVKLLDSEISSVIVESPIEQMVGPKVDEMTESNEPIDQAITDKTMDQANDMEVDQPNEPNDQTKIDEALNVANDMELAEPNEMTDPAISDEPFNENERVSETFNSLPSYFIFKVQ